MNTRRAQPFDGVARDLIGLDAPDDLLDVGVEILHPDGGAVHPRSRQRVDAGGVDLVRVDLDREFGIRRKAEGLMQRLGQITHHRR